MYTDFRVCSFKVDDIAAAKSIYRVTRQEYNELFRNPNLSTEDIVELERIKKEKVENLLKQELETFQKQKVLPKEKLVLKLNEFIKKLGISGPRVSDDLKELQKKYNFKIQPAGAKPDGSLLTADQQKKYKLNYKTKTMAQIAEEISGKTMANQKTKDVYGRLR